MAHDLSLPHEVDWLRQCGVLVEEIGQLTGATATLAEPHPGIFVAALDEWPIAGPSRLRDLKLDLENLAKVARAAYTGPRDGFTLAGDLRQFAAGPAVDHGDAEQLEEAAKLLGIIETERQKRAAAPDPIVAALTNALHAQNWDAEAEAAITAEIERRVNAG